MPVPTIEWKNNKARIIDQTLLPNRLRFLGIGTAKEMWRAIKKLKIRGAPAIGVAGAFGMYLAVRRSGAKTFPAFFGDVERAERYLASSRPTARNLFWALERMKRVALENRHMPVPRLKKRLLDEAIDVLNEDKKICRDIGKYGSKLVKKKMRILTHCNAGGLATADYGTALAVIFRAHHDKKHVSVFVDETRPVLQGSRLTAWELVNEGVDATLISDNMAASLMAKGRVDMVIVGADRIAPNGDTANKIGTYNLAVLCRAHSIPFYVAAPASTFDFRIKSGRDIIIEERDPDEVRTVMGVNVAPRGMKVYNPAFDVTPHGLITAFVTEKGILRKPFRKNLRKLM